MRILLADDDLISRLMLESMLVKWGYEVVLACDGSEAWQILEGESAPKLAVLDWIMPGMDGVEICRRLRKDSRDSTLYIILLTAKDSKEDIVSGLRAGANDFVSKPFDNEELHARVQVGERFVELQTKLDARIKELQEALAHIKTLQGILPICSYCKNIRDDKKYWQKLESYISKHSEAQFSHSICPECYERHVKPKLK
jgi:DNA-binding response OmpR family regulator